MSVVVITPPASAATSMLSLVKAQVRVSHGDDDVLLTSLIDAAAGWIAGPYGWLGRSLLPQTLELRLEDFSTDDWCFGGQYVWNEACNWDWARWPTSHRIKLPCPPVIEVVSITYEDKNGVDQVLTSDGWKLDGEGGVEPTWQMPWPSGRVEADAVRICYTAGYPVTTGSAPAPTLPAPIRHAILLLASHWYRNPEAVAGIESRDSPAEVPLGVDALLLPFRVWAPSLTA